MGYILRTVKKIFFWNYARNTWQYDVLCALILAFIFLTPQSWFDTRTPMKTVLGGEPAVGQEHQKPVASRVILSVSDNFSPSLPRKEIENRVRDLTGRPDTQVLDVRERTGASGKIVAYEVDIR
jgi:hypothetical protein